jgi:hypothetical protein
MVWTTPDNIPSIKPKPKFNPKLTLQYTGIAQAMSTRLLYQAQPMPPSYATNLTTHFSHADQTSLSPTHAENPTLPSRVRLAHAAQLRHKSWVGRGGGFLSIFLQSLSHSISGSLSVSLRHAGSLYLSLSLLGSSDR